MAAENARKAEITWSSMSFADDESFSFSIDLNDSVFDSTCAFDRSVATTGSTDMDISDNTGNGDKVNDKQDDTPLSRAYNVGDKRFERALDAGCIKNDVIKFNPVRNKLIEKCSKLYGCLGHKHRTLHE